MKRGVTLLLFLCLLSCSRPTDREPSALDQWVEDTGRLKVLCTIGMIHDIAVQIGGDQVDSISLITGQLDPHSYELVKGDDEKLRYADIIFYNGLGLEHGPSLRHHLEGNPKATAVTKPLLDLAPERVLYFSGQPDPHVWTDISIWVYTVDQIVETFIQKVPEKANVFRSNGKRVREEMMETHHRLHAFLQKIPEHKRYLVTSHDAFNYFARTYLSSSEERADGTWIKRCRAPEGLTPEGRLSSLDIKRITDHIAKYRISVLFPESNVSQDSIRKIVSVAKEYGLSVKVANTTLYADAMGMPGSGGETYLKMIEHNAKTFASHLNGQPD